MEFSAIDCTFSILGSLATKLRLSISNAKDCKNHLILSEIQKENLPPAENSSIVILNVQDRDNAVVV